MSENINETTRHLKFSYISILTNLLWTDNETKCKKSIQLPDQLKKIKRIKSRLKRNKNAIKQKRKNSLCTSKTKS